MQKVEKKLEDCLAETKLKLDDPGLLLVSAGKNGVPNVMAIGWGLVGRLWARPVFMVAVRPSRYTFGLIEETGEFTVNIPKKGMEETVEYCGTVSGRDRNKFQERSLTLVKSRRVAVPIISECSLHYECKVIYKARLDSTGIPNNILSEFYPSNDFHTIYFGQILRVCGDR